MDNISAFPEDFGWLGNHFIQGTTGAMYQFPDEISQYKNIKLTFFWGGVTN